MAQQQIVVYGVAWCPDCVRTRRFLDGRGIPYEWHDIDKEAEGRAYVERVNKGNRSVPTMVFSDGSILVEPSNAQLEQKLGA